MFEAGTAGRAALAWLGACVSAGAGVGIASEMAGAFGYYDEWPLYGESGWFVLPSALALPIWLPFARSLHWSRPLTDAYVFAFSSMSLPLVAFFWGVLYGRKEVFPIFDGRELVEWLVVNEFLMSTAHSGLRLPGGMSPAEWCLQVALQSALIGACSGVAYWLLAARPRPPYAAQRYK